MFKMKFCESQNCECNDARETIEHFLMECEIYKVNRETMIKEVGERWMSNMKRGSLTMDTYML